MVSNSENHLPFASPVLGLKVWPQLIIIVKCTYLFPLQFNTNPSSPPSTSHKSSPHYPSPFLLRRGGPPLSVNLPPGRQAGNSLRDSPCSSCFGDPHEDQAAHLLHLYREAYVQPKLAFWLFVQFWEPPRVQVS